MLAGLKTCLSSLVRFKNKKLLHQQIWVVLCRDHDLFINYFIHWPYETSCKNYELQEVHLPSYRNVLGSPSHCHHFHMYIISICINLVKWWLDHYLCWSMKKLIQTELLTKATNETVLLLSKQIFEKMKCVNYIIPVSCFLDPWPWLEGLYELGSVCLSVWKFSWDCLISFFLKLSMVFRAYVVLCATEPDFFLPPKWV